MKKIKGLLFAFVALFAFTLVMVKVNAATEDIVSKATIDKASVTVDGITFTSSGMKTGVTISGISLIDETEKTFTTGAKLNSGGTLKFTASYAWSAQILFSSGTASQALKTSSGAGAVVSSNAVNGLGTYLIQNGQPGEVTIERGGSKEMWVFEIVLTQTKNLDAEYVDVYFHDVAGNAGAATPVEKGAKATAKNADPILGKQFVNWKLEDGTVFDFNTAINEETHLYPVYSDVAVSVDNANVLSKGYLNTLLSVLPTMPTINEETQFINTNYALAKGTGLMNDDSKKFPGDENKILYGINTGGTLNLTDDVWTNGVKFTASSAGTFNIYGRSGNSSLRKVAITTDNETFVYSEEVGQDNIVLITLNVTAAGTYYIGCKEGGFKFYSIEFVAQPQQTSSVNLYQERVAVGENENLRLVAVVENVDVPTITSFVLKSDSFTADLDLKDAAKIATRVTDNGESYSLNDVTFDVKDGVVYVKCVVELASKYASASFTAELTIGGITKTVTINALA